MGALFLIFLLLQTLSVSVVRTDSSEECEWKWWDWWSDEDWQEWCDIYESYNITTDISEEAIPASVLQVWFGDKFVSIGDVLTPLDTTGPPKLAWLCDDQKYYTVILINLDVPVSDRGDAYVVWRVDGISDCDMSTGTTTAPFVAPLPLPGLGTHRYPIMVFEHSEYIPSVLHSLVKGTAGGISFSTADYIKKHGRPIAGNVFFEKSIVLGEPNLAPFASEVPVGPVMKVKSSIEDMIP